MMKKPILPKRPRQHELEDLSVTVLRQAIPSNWQFREKKSEYGIDGEIEIFTSEGYTTGLICHVQLKSTDDASSKALRVRINTSTYRYWRQLTQPVLLVRHVEHGKQLFVKWNYRLDPTPKQLASRSFSFVFLETDRWTETTSSTLETELRYIQQANAPLSRPLNVAFRFESLSAEQETYAYTTLNQVRIISASRKLPFAYKDVAAADAIVVIEVLPTEIRLSVARKPGAVLDLRDTDWQAKAPAKLAAHILSLLVLALANARQEQLAVEVAAGLLNELVTLKNWQVLLRVAQILARHGRLDTLFELYSRIEEPHPEFAIAVLAMTLGRIKDAPDPMLAKLLELHSRAAEQAPSEEEAPLRYRMFQILLHLGRYCEALEELEKIEAADPTYPERDYFYQERGLCYFELAQYDKALEDYRKAERLGFGKHIKALQADCLFRSGRYQQAAQLWKVFFDSNKNTRQWLSWVLPFYVARYICLNLGIACQNRNKNSYSNKVPPFNPNVSLEEAISECQPLLRSDALDPFVWFNLGVHAISLKNYAFAEFAFIVSGIVNGRDPESWRNAALAALSAHSPSERLAAIIYVGMHYCGEEFRTAVVDNLRENHTSVASEMDKLIHDLYESSHEEHNIIRIIAPGGKDYGMLKVGRRGNLTWLPRKRAKRKSRR